MCEEFGMAEFWSGEEFGIRVWEWEEFMTTELQSMAVEMPEVKGHPNRVGFRGVLTVVDVASDRAPSGSKGKRVMLTRRAAEAAIPSLIGMAVDYAPSLDRHDAQRKVGVITRAELVGRNLEVGGYLYAKDFPEIVAEIGKNRASDFGRQASGFGVAASGGGGQESGARLRSSLASAVKEIRRLIQTARGGRGEKESDLALRAETPLVVMGSAGAGTLGMSFEVTKVNVLNKSARIWKLIGVTFTGAAILRKDKAAFQDTWIELE